MMLRDMGIAVCGVAQSAGEAASLAVQRSPRLVLMDVRLKGAADGIDAAAVIHRANGAKIIFVSGSARPGDSGADRRNPSGAGALQAGEVRRAEDGDTGRDELSERRPAARLAD
jgi:CheY-like chemotaxis protein